MVDPFFKHMPRFFDLSFEQLMKAKHPTAWVEFEVGKISEEQLFDRFFLDGRRFDGDALRQAMVRAPLSPPAPPCNVPSPCKPVHAKSLL